MVLAHKTRVPQGNLVTEWPLPVVRAGQGGRNAIAANPPAATAGPEGWIAITNTARLVRPLGKPCFSHAVTVIRCAYLSPRLEGELAAINRRLDQLTNLLPEPNQSLGSAETVLINRGYGQDPDPVLEKSPFQLLVTECMMKVFGLEAGFARNFTRLERRALPTDPRGVLPRVHIIQRETALAALGAFSTYVHIWYPILHPGFSECYLRIITGPLVPCPQTCLVLLVAAVGTQVLQDHALGTSPREESGGLYLEAASASLASVLVGCGIESIQCLVLLSIYYCCLSKPCQAYDYAMIASIKVQNLLKATDMDGGELDEEVKRAYWAILLLESELSTQLDVVETGIWNHDDSMALPDGRHTSRFDAEDSSPHSAVSRPTGHALSSSTASDTSQAYFLAEISMRRMLHRSNTAIRRSHQGVLVYAPGIARELELQLDEWYSYLPDLVRFPDLLSEVASPSHSASAAEAQVNFLRCQYYCCKISIYWPAVYQCIQDGTASPETLKHCERFFHGYIQLMPSLLVAVQSCIVNRWTIYVTVFMTSMAVLQAIKAQCLIEGCSMDWPILWAALRSTTTVDGQVVEGSPALSLLADTLAQRLVEASNSLENIT